MPTPLSQPSDGGPAAAPAAVRRVVVLRALGLGDLLAVVPALRALRRAHPQATITVAAPGWLEPVARMSGAVDRLVDTPPPTFDPGSIRPLDPVLSGADLAVNLHGRGPQSTALLRATGPATLVSYGVTARWRDDEHEVARWCRLLSEAGMPADPGDLALAPPPGEPVARGAVLVHPGTAAASRRWPAERWAQVARRLPGRVLVTAGPGEEPLAARVAALAGLDRTAVVAGLDLPGLVALVAAARLVLAPDTGVAHLATALGTPSVVLFGPVGPDSWGPPPGRPQHAALWTGRTSDPFASGPAPALLELSPQTVLAAVDRLAGRGG